MPKPLIDALSQFQASLQMLTPRTMEVLSVTLPEGMFSVFLGELAVQRMPGVDRAAASGMLVLGLEGGEVCVRASPSEIPPPKETAFPVPHVVRPTMLQLVKGARVEYEGADGKPEYGWVGEFGELPTEYRGLTQQEAPKAWGLMVDVNQPGSAMVTFLAPSFVPIEKVRRATCQPDAAPGPCWKCGQSGEAMGGEHPCQVCSRPTTHDPVQQPVVRMSSAEVMEISAAGHEAVRAGTAMVTDSATGQTFASAAEVIREGHRRIGLQASMEANDRIMAACEAAVKRGLLTKLPNGDFAASTDEGRDFLKRAADAQIPEAFVHGAEYISKTDCNRWIAGTEHMSGQAGVEIYGKLAISRDDRKAVTCPQCLSR